MSVNENAQDGSGADADPAEFRVSEANSEFRARLRAAVDDAGGVDAVAAKSGVPRGSLYSYINTPREPKASALAKIAAATGRSMDWLLAIGAPPSEAGVMEAGVPLSSKSGGQLAALVDSIVNIERLAFAGSAGPGSLVLQEAGDMSPVPKALLQRLHLKPEHARVLEAVGNSMLPTIHDGDPLIVDVSPAARSRIADDAVYAFTIGDEAYIKRLRREPGQLMMVSDNAESFPARPVPAGEPFVIIGRICWVGHEV